MNQTLKYSNLNKSTKDDFKIYAFSDYKELSKVRKFVFKNAIQFGFNDKEAQDVALAVDEACSNLIRYAYHFDKHREFCIRIEHSKDEFVVNIYDDGEPFNPLEVELPDMESHLKSYPRGGLGVFIMRKVMDEISYTPSKGPKSHNILKLKKILH